MEERSWFLLEHREADGTVRPGGKFHTRRSCNVGDTLNLPPPAGAGTVYRVVGRREGPEGFAAMVTVEAVADEADN